LPFDLHPEYPPEGIEAARLSERYGFDINEQHKRLFGENGLPCAERTLMRNSHAALNVAELARERGLANEMHARLMHAFWAEDRDISDPDVLADEGARAGLDPDEVRDVAINLPYEEQIAASTKAVAEMGAGGVPAFVIDDKVLIPGAQPHELFEKVMERLGFASVGSTEADAPRDS
jgi:predicted DsbA family dithiol-disulfide isomerase